MGDNLISVNNVSVNFDYQENFISKKQKIHAVNNINIKIKKGSFFGLVGESGSGKTTLGRAILGANKISSGNVIFHDDERDYDLTNMNKQDLKEYRKKAQLIFQDPYAALSPRMTVRDIIAEPLEVMKITNSRQETDERVRDIAAKCRLNKLKKSKKLKLYSQKGNFTYEGGYAATAKILTNKKVSAIFCADDTMAFGCLDYIKKNTKIEIPNDIEIFGYDDISMANWSSYNLSTVKQPLRQMSKLVTQLINDNIKDPDYEAVSHLIQGTLIKRKTSR